MILDAHNQLSDSQALTATAASTNIIDFGSDRNIGIGEQLALLVNVEVAADFTTGDETYSVAIQADDNASFSSATTVASFSIIGGTAAGTKFVQLIPADQTTERFLRLNYTLAGTSPSVTVSAHIIPANNGVDNYVAYADGFTIS